MKLIFDELKSFLEFLQAVDCSIRIEDNAIYFDDTYLASVVDGVIYVPERSLKNFLNLADLIFEYEEYRDKAGEPEEVIIRVIRKEEVN